jgi:hypothetical protein
MQDNRWDSPCYQTVDLDEAIEQEELYKACHVSEGSWNFHATLLSAETDTLDLTEATKIPEESKRTDVPVKEIFDIVNNFHLPEIPMVISLIKILKMLRNGEKEESSSIGPLVEFRNAEVVVGTRRPWVDVAESLAIKKLNNELNTTISKLKEFIKSLSIKVDNGAKVKVSNIRGRDLSEFQDELFSEEYVGQLSANDLYKAWELAVAANVEIDGDLDSIHFDSGSTPNLDGPVVSIGGPLPNFYTRRVMYDEEFDLKYRFDLNPDNVEEDLSEVPPNELRSKGLKDQEDFSSRPEWKIVDKSGDIPKIENAPTKPKRSDDRWYRDYFTVFRVPNPYQDSERESSQKRSLVCAGCHGLGTRTAVESVIDGTVREKIDERGLSDGSFQLLGRVKRQNDGSVSYTIPEAHVVGLSCGSVGSGGQQF